MSRYEAICDDIVRDCGDIDTLVAALACCAEEFAALGCSGELRVVVNAMLRLAQRCEDESRRDQALALCARAQTWAPAHSDDPEDRHARGWALQRQGKLLGGRDGIALVRQSIDLLDAASTRGQSYLVIGNLWQDVARTERDGDVDAVAHRAALDAYAQAFTSYQLAGQTIDQVSVTVAWAEPALGLEPVDKIRQRLDIAIQALVGCYVQLFTRADVTPPADVPLLQKLERAGAQLQATGEAEPRQKFLTLLQYHAAAQVQLGKTYLVERNYARAKGVVGGALLLARLAGHASLQTGCTDVLRQLEQKLAGSREAPTA